MQTETVAIAALKPPARNVRTHPEQQIVELARAVEMFGQTRPVVIDEENTVLAGNGLVAACRRLGRAEVVAYRITGLSRAAKAKLMLSDNRIYALGLDDNNAILETIRGLDDFEIPGFDADLLKNLAFDPVPVAAAALDNYGRLPEPAVAAARNRRLPEPVPGEPAGSEPGAPDPADELICPHCGHVFAPR